MLHRERGYVFKFYASDGREPAHVHVLGNGGDAKIWLMPSVEIADSWGYDVRQRNTISKVTKEHRDEWLAAWGRFFGRA